MKTVLKEKLWAYVAHNNPDLMFSLQEDYKVTNYLDGKVDKVLPLAEKLLADCIPWQTIEQQCLDEMTEDLRPSKFVYLRSLIEEEFPKDYNRLREAGLLTYEVMKILEACKAVFENFGFSKQNKEDRLLRYAIIGQVHDFLL